MTELVLVRHGETVWHAENRYAGSTDVALTDRGLAQAGSLAVWAGTAALTAVYCSPLTRARQTAAPSAEAARLDLVVEPRLRELHFGDGEGLTSREMRERFPEAYQRFLADPGENPLPGGEPPRDCVERFLSALDDLAARHPTGRVLVVAHNTAVRLVLCRVVGAPLGRYRDLFPRLDNCTLTTLRAGPQGLSILTYNSSPVPGA